MDCRTTTLTFLAKKGLADTAHNKRNVFVVPLLITEWSLVSMRKNWTDGRTWPRARIRPYNEIQ